MKNDYEIGQGSNICLVSGKKGSPQSYPPASRYLSRSLQLVMIFSLLLCGLLGTAQTVLISPTGDGGFENGSTFTANGWTVSNSANNPWVVGTAASAGAITGNSAYVSSTGGTTHVYDIATPAANYFYRDITVPANEVKINLSFNWVGQGEGSGWDVWQVFIAPVSVTPVGSTTHPGSGLTAVPAAIAGATNISGGELQGTPQTATLTLPSSLAGTTFRLIFLWKNDDNTGIQPPTAIDNISLTSTAPTEFISVASGSFGTAATWNVNAVPTSLDNVTVMAGHTVTINASSLSAYNVTVNGTLEYGSTPSSFAVNKNLTVNAGGLVNVFNGTTGKTLNVAGNITNNGTINVSVGATTGGNLTLNGATAQTVSGTGTFTNNVIRNLVFSNTSTAIPNINWLVNNLSVEYNLNITNAKINLAGNKFTYGTGITATTAGNTFTVTGGGFMNGTFSRWWTNGGTGYTSAATSLATGSAGRYPFYTPDGQLRLFYIGRTTPTAGGQYAVTYNHASTMTSGLSIADGAYTITDRHDGQYIVTAEGGPTAASYFVTIFAPNAYFAINGNSRVMGQSAIIGGTHVASSSIPAAQRSGVSLADLTLATGLYMGVNAADIPFVAVANGNWNAAATWNKGLVPACTDEVVIPSGMNVTVNSAANVASKVTINAGGILTVASGDLTVGCTNNNNMLVNNGTLAVTGGTLNVNGNMSHSTTSTFNQSGGDIVVDGNNAGATATSVASGTPLISITTSQINWTGGTLTIVDPHAATTATNVLSYDVATNANASGTHTLRFGNGTSADAGGNAIGFRIGTFVGSGRIAFNNVTVSTTAGGTNRFVVSSSAFGVLGNLTIDAGGEFRPGAVVHVGGNIVNNGNYLTTSAVNLANFTNGTSTAVTIPQTVSGTGVFANNATTPTATFSSFGINNTNAAGVTLANPYSVSGTLTLTAGKVNTTAATMLTLGTATAAGTLTGGSATAYINGPFARTIANSNANTNYILFPVGKAEYAPIWLAPATTAVSVFKAEAFDSNTGTFDASLMELSTNRRWEAPLISGTITSINVRLANAAFVSDNIPVMAPTADGIYTNAFGTVSVFAAGPPPTIQSTVAPAVYSGFVSYAKSNLCVGTPAPGATIASATTICSGTSVSFSVANGTTGSGVTYQWQRSVDGVTFTDIATATSPTYVTTPTESLYYRLNVTCANGPVTGSSTPVLVAFSSSITATTPATRCGAGAVTLNATSSAGSTPYWYTAATGGTVAGTGNSFTTTVPATTNFYVSSTQAVPGSIITIGAGATTTATYSNPFYSLWSNNHTQHLITAQELSSAGLSAGPINSIALDVTSAGSLPMIDLSIKIGASTATSLTAFTSNAGFSTVYTSASHMPTVGVNTFTFTTPFNWDGTSNIVVEFCHGNPDSGATMSRTVKADATSYVSSVKAHFGSATGAGTICGNTSNNLVSYSLRPQFIFNGTGLCQSTRQLVVATVTTPPALTLSAGTATICNGQSTPAVTLTAGAADYDTYVWSPSTGVTGTAATGWTFNPTVTTTYTLQASQSAGTLCNAAPVSVVVTVNPLPTPLTVTNSVTGDACIDSVVTLTAVGGNSPSNATIGTGTTAPGDTTHPNPFNAWYGGHWTQMLYRKAELEAQGLSAGSVISSVAFDFAVTENNTLVDLTIRIGNTANTTTTGGFVPASSLSTVYNGTYTPVNGATGFVTFNFTTPFTWDGNSSLIIEVAHNSGNGGNGAGTTTKTTTTTYDSVYYLVRDNVTPAGVASLQAVDVAAITTKGTRTERPNIRLNYGAQDPITWSPATNLYTDAAATTPYVLGTAAPKVYVKSATAGNTTYTATATTALGCTVSNTTNVTVINCAIDFANLQSPATATINPCESQVVTGQVFKTGVTEAAGAATGMKAWVGVSTTNSDPSTWTEANWNLAAFSTQAGNNDEYTYTITGLPAGTYYYATRYQYLAGPYAYGGLSGIWNGTTSTSGTLTVTPVSAPVVTDLTYCNEAPTVATLKATVTGTNVKVYTASTGGTALADATLLVSGTYHVSQTISGCEGPRAEVDVTLNTTLAPATTNAVFCNASPTIANLAANATGTNLKWYAALTGGTELASTTALTAGDYFVSQTINGCEGPRGTVTVTLNTTVMPTANNITLCSGSTVANLAPAATGTNLKWYAALTGGTELASTTALVAGDYFVSQTINGCEGPRATVTVTIDVITAPVVTLVQPTCTTATGSITVTSPVGAAYTYSIDGTNFQASATFAALVPGTYTITAKNATNCTAATADLVINAAPALPTFTTTLTQPTCAVATGSVTVGDMGAAGYTFSIDGTNFQASPTFTGLAAGDYTITVQTTAGCTATAAITINAAPIVPAAPTAIAAQTLCAGSTVADIDVTTGTSLQWYSSLTGNDPIASTTPLVNGTSYFVSQNNGACESTRTEVVVTIPAVLVDDIADQVVACGTYTLPALTNGNYFGGTNGTGTAYTAGQVISSDMTMFIFNQVGECTAETSFTIDVNVVAAPTGDAVQTVEVHNLADATVEDLTVTLTGGTLTWYATLADALAGAPALPATTQLVNGENYFAVQTIGTCSSAPFEVTVTVTLGRNDFDIQNIKVYPNPVVEKLVISYSSNITNVEVYDLLGKRVIVEQPNTTTATINMSHLEAATYIVKVTADGMTKDVKVVKRN